MSSLAASFAPMAARGNQPLRLAMQRLWLTGQILPAGGRLIVQHVFRSGETEPLEAIYSFALPRDAALRAFRITGDGFEAHSELKPTDEAVKEYERGIAQGSLSTLARQYGDGVVNLTVGNIRPNETITVYLEILAGVELRDDGFRFRFPFILAPAYHSQMKAARLAAGEGEIELPSAEFGDVILPRFRDDASSLHEVGFDLSVVHQLALSEVASPSHSISVRHGDATRIALAPERDVPNRDLVVDVRFREIAPQVLSGPSTDGKRCFAAIVPSTSFGQAQQTPRRVAILLDRSGSMSGAPLEQAKKAIEACLATLDENDSFAIVAFNNTVESVAGDREEAHAFLHQMTATGGTELAAGFAEAALLLSGAGEMLIVTDGQVFGTEQILAKARELGIRLFCLGIGSASQDRFLSLLARETGGISRFLTANERVDLAAVDLFASMGRPVATSLETNPPAEPAAPTAVFAGTPVLLFGETGEPALTVSWSGGRLTMPIPDGNNESVRLLQGSRLITDWESRYPASEAVAPLEKRQQSRIAARLIELSERYGLASREMSLVAVVKREGDRPGELPRTQVVPVGLPQDVQPAAYFPAPSAPVAYHAVATGAGIVSPKPADMEPPAARRAFTIGSMFRGLGRSRRPEPPALEEALEEMSSSEDLLLELAAMLQPDGGMPGKDDAERIARTVKAILEFAKNGHTTREGAFRTHVQRLVNYLKTQPSNARIEKAIKAAESVPSSYA